MRVRRTPVLWLLAWCGPLLMAGLTVGAVVTGQPIVPTDAQTFANVYPNIVFAALLPLLGALILSRVPRQPIGLLFLGCGLASALTLTVYSLADLGLQQHRPWAPLAAWVSEWIWGLGLIPLVTIGVLLFPDGRPPSRRWRPLLWADLVAVLLVFLANAFHPGPLVNFDQVDNPLGLPVPDVIFAILRTAGMALFLVGLVGGVVSAVLRWRRARDVERAQLGWFAFAVALLAAGLLIPSPRAVADVVLVVAVPLLPISVAVAILRTRLYGIEVVIRRSLVYAALTAVLLIGYALSVSAIDALLRGRATDAAALVATALVAIGFAPVRNRLQHAVDRMLYGDRDDPYAVLTGLGRRLDTEDERDPLGEVADTVARSLRLPYVRVEVDRDGEAPLTGVHGEPVSDVHEVPLTFRGEHLGRLVVAPRTRHDPFRPADLRLLDDLGRQIGVAAHATRLAAALQRSREGLVTTREEERRRIRRDLHDGLGPTLAGLALGLDAVHRLAAEHPDQAAALADQLKGEVQASLADVRRLVEDLRPPALDELGLVGAIRQQARLLTERDPGLEVRVESTGVGELPAAVEVAAYRIVTESLTNVARHASARQCRVSLCLDGSGQLRLDVDDDGIGLQPHRRHGVGLSAMQERAAELGGTCEVGPATPHGTRVTAVLPVLPVLPVPPVLPAVNR